MQARTFVETSRRAQIVAAAIETIAAEGYAHASFAKIAKRAGLSSTGLISYHFASKRELVEQVVTRVYSQLREFMTERLDGQPTATAALRTYIESNVEFSATHPTQMQALLHIFVSGDLDYDQNVERETVSAIERILRWGQAGDEFRDFNVRVMATSIQRCVEGPTFLLAGEPGLDVDAYADELATLFDLATRKAQ